MVNRFSSLGSALGRQAQQVATPSSAGNALAGAVRRSAPPPPVQRQASTAGQRAFQHAQPAIQQAVNRFAQGAAQPSDEPWVSVVNEDDPADILYMPQSVAENRPSNYLISRVLDPYETQARQNPDNPENIYAQPPEIQAAFGIAMPGLGVSDPKDVRPTDFASFVRQATENLRTEPGIDYLMQGILPTGEEYLSDPAYAIARILGTEPTVPEPQPPVDPTSGMTPVGASPVENRDSIIERAAGSPTGLLPSLRARAESAPVSSGSDNLLDILMGVNIPGLNQTVGEVADVLEEPAQGAQGTITDIFRDITNANPREWFLTEGVPFLQAVQDAIGIDRDEAFRIWEPGDWSASLANLIEEGIGQGIAAIGSASEAIMPETLEDVPGLFIAAINYPADKSQAWRIDTMMKAITGQELSTEEEQYVRVMVGSEAVSDLTKELPFGIGWGLEKGENVVPMDLEWWIIRNPDKAQQAHEEGGARAVWEAYQEDTTGEGIGGLLLRFIREASNDPLTGLPIAGAAGKGVSRIGRGLRMAPDAGIARQVIGEIFEGAGEGVYRTTRGAEMIADLGLEPILDVIARGVNATGITQPTRGAQRQRISDEIHGALDVVQGTQTRVNANQVGPDGQPVGPDAGGPPLVVDDVTRATTDGEPGPQTAPDGQPVGPTRGGDGGAPTTAGTPTRAIPEAEVQQTGAGAARLTEDQAAARIDTAQSQPEPPVEGAGAIQVGEAVTYTPEIAIRRVDDGWQVEVSTDGVNVERYTPAPWRDALSDAEITRQNLGIDASRVTTISPRWVPDIARGQRVIDQIVRDMPDATTRSRFMESMADEWNESVDRQATIKRGGTPVVDQAIESSRITHATYQQARQSLPGGWTPRYESGRTPQGVGNPYQAAEDVIHQSWANTAPQRRFLYRNPNHGWGGAAPGISTSDAERIRDSIPQNFSRKSGAEKTRILEQARRYVDLVNEHERWMPDDPSPGWAEAKAKRDAILANPHFQKYQQSKNHLISEGGLPGSRRTQGMRDAERRGRETEAQRQRDAEVDPRYELTEVMDDGTLVYRIDGDHTAYITPERRSDIPAAIRDQFKDHPDYENSRWFTGHIERDGQNVTGSRTHPNQAELLDELTAEANITPRTDTPDGDTVDTVERRRMGRTSERGDLASRAIDTGRQRRSRQLGQATEVEQPATRLVRNPHWRDDIVQVTRRHPDGRAVTYVGRTADDTPVRIIERRATGRSMEDEVDPTSLDLPFEIQYHRGDGWVRSDTPEMREVFRLAGISNADPTDMLEIANAVLNDVETIRRQRPDEFRPVVPDEDMADITQDWQSRGEGVEDKTVPFRGRADLQEVPNRPPTNLSDAPPNVIDLAARRRERITGSRRRLGETTEVQSGDQTVVGRRRMGRTAEVGDDGSRIERRRMGRAEEAPSARTEESEPAPGTKDFADEVVAPPDTTPAPRATIPPQVRHAPQSMARAMGQPTRRRPIARSTDFTGTTNEGFLFAEPGGRNAIPLAPEIEELLEGFTFSDGTSLKKRLDDLKWHFMNGKSRMWAGDAETAAINQAVKEVEERLLERFPDRNIPIPLKRFLKVWDGIIQYQRERMLFGWEKAISYPAIQATGNAAIALMNGKASWIPYYTTKGWRDARRKALDAPKKQAALDEFNAKLRKQAARQDRKTKKGPLAEKHDATLLEQRKVIYRRLAEEGDPRPWRRDPGLPAYSKMLADLNLGEGREIRDLTQGIYADLDDDLMVTKLLKKIGTPEHNLGGLGKLTGSKRIGRWGTYWDSAWRHTVGLYTMRNKLAEITPDFRNYVKQRMEQWHPDADADAIWDDFWAKNKDGLFSADDLYTHYREAGLTEGQATRLHRDWQSRLNTAHKETRDEIRRITYAGDETNADAVLRRTLVFHYFFSRQAWNFAHQMAKHPFLINAYFELQDELAQYAEEHDGIVPDWMKGWVAMVGAPGGMNLFINPVHLFSTYLMFNQEMDFKPEGITDFGEILRTIDGKVGLAPFLMAGFNLLGYMGDDWAPDPFMLWREARTITTAINFARARGWIGDSVRPIGNIYEDFMSQAREWISGLGLPGSEEVPATSSVLKMHREIHAIAIDEARKMGRDPQFEDGSPTNEDAIWVMAQLEDEDSELYQRSVKRWTAGELATIAIQDVASPLRPRTRFAMESGEGQEIGAGGSEINPDLMGSVSEMEAYDVTGTTPEAMELIRQKAEYDMIGTDEQQKASRVYNNLVYGDYLYEINLDGTIYTPEDIRAMSLDERKQLAMAFLVDRGVDDDWVAYQDERREFLSREENREFATFDRWADEVRDYDGGILAYWDELISDPDNADARWYYESVLQAGYSRERTEIMLTTPDAYLAAQGITYDPFAPVFQGGGEDPLGIFDGPKRPQADDGYVNEYHEELRNDAPKVAQEMIQWDEAVSRKQAEFGIDPSIPFNDLDYKTRKSIEDALEDEGVKEPDIPHSMKLYLAWVDEQPPGADVSVEAFIEWDSAQYRAGAKDRLAESVAMPEMTNEEALAVIGRLRKEHDHRTYGDSSSSGGGGGR